MKRFLDFGFDGRRTIVVSTVGVMGVNLLRLCRKFAEIANSMMFWCLFDGSILETPLLSLFELTNVLF